MTFDPSNPEPQQAPQEIVFPPLRLFSVARYDVVKDEHVTESIEAHYINSLDQEGAVWGFFQYVLTPQGQAGEMKKLRSAVTAIDDVTVIDVRPFSSLIVH